MATSEEIIHDLLSNHPLAPLHSMQIYTILQENGNNITFDEVDAVCTNMDGKNLVDCENRRCYSVKE